VIYPKQTDVKSKLRFATPGWGVLLLSCLSEGWEESASERVRWIKQGNFGMVISQMQKEMQD